MELSQIKNEYNDLAALIEKELGNEEDRALWRDTIPYLENNEAQSLLDLLREDPAQLALLTKNLQEKIETLKNNGEEAMKKITEEEAYTEGL